MTDKERLDWVEKEVYQNGVVQFHPSETYVDIKKTGVLKAHRNGKFIGFSISSQHINKEDYCLNIRQLIDCMIRKSNDRA